jgi:hypothetical protein
MSEVWRAVTETDLATVLDAEELALYRERATTDAGVDPVPALIENAVQEARDRIRAYRENALAPGSTLPPGMIARCLILIRQRVLTICKVSIGEDRRKEAESAEAYFRDVAKGLVSVPQPETTTTETAPPKARPKYQAPDRGNTHGI